MDEHLPNKDWTLQATSKLRLVEKLRENRGTALEPVLGNEYRVLLCPQRRPGPRQEPRSSCFCHKESGRNSTGGNQRPAVGTPVGCTALN